MNLSVFSGHYQWQCWPSTITLSEIKVEAHAAFLKTSLVYRNGFSIENGFEEDQPGVRSNNLGENW